MNIGKVSASGCAGTRTLIGRDDFAEVDREADTTEHGVGEVFVPPRVGSRRGFLESSEDVFGRQYPAG